jgi:hypothetical protein
VSTKKKFLIRNGVVKGIYDDKDSPQLLEKLGGKANIRRASHVEAPLHELDKVEFEVDLSLSGGPILKGFKTYKDAVEAEVEWLHNNILCSSAASSQIPQ